MLIVIAAVSMLFDHVGLLFFPHVVAFRIIGRVAFPCFAFLLSEGFYHTSNLERYVKRLLVCSVVAQLPFSFMHSGGFLVNSVFLFPLAVLCCAEFYSDRNGKVYGKIALFVLCSLYVEFAPVDYGFYGFMVCLVFIIWRGDELLKFFLFSYITLWYAYIAGNPLECFAVFAVPLIYIFRDDQRPVVKWGGMLHYFPSKRFFYYFYPAHLVILVLLRGVL